MDASCGREARANDVRFVSAREGAKSGCFQCCGLAMRPIRVTRDSLQQPLRAAQTLKPPTRDVCPEVETLKLGLNPRPAQLVT